MNKSSACARLRQGNFAVIVAHSKKLLTKTETPEYEEHGHTLSKSVKIKVTAIITPATPSYGAVAHSCSIQGMS